MKVRWIMLIMFGLVFCGYHVIQYKEEKPLKNFIAKSNLCTQYENLVSNDMTCKKGRSIIKGIKVTQSFFTKAYTLHLADKTDPSKKIFVKVKNDDFMGMWSIVDKEVS